MTIHEQLAAFDGWLTLKIEEAHRAGKDLAFRDCESAAPSAHAWEYSLLDPGHASPEGGGWSVYRLQGIWPEFLQDAMFAAERSSAAAR
jgi:hypothetical protein